MTAPPPRLAGPLLARARAYLDSAEAPVNARPAATVALLRDGPDGVQAYLLRRVPTMAFASGMHVFPGGGVDPRDADAEVAWAGPPPAAWAQPLAADESLARALVCAAVRETFEESGVLLAGPDTDEIVADTSGQGWEADRRALLDRSIAFTALLDRRGLVLRADLLRGWAHWITPEFEERRYDTRFFVAALPSGQRTRDVGGEADAVAWLSAASAVEGFEAGRLAMLPPTVATLRELAAYGSVTEVLDAAQTRRFGPILPRLVVEGEELRMLLPGDAGWPG
jgi:8-oxo-dGTP pyrophosphatase MutT (NUDIX family)